MSLSKQAISAHSSSSSTSLLARVACLPSSDSSASFCFLHHPSRSTTTISRTHRSTHPPNAQIPGGVVLHPSIYTFDGRVASAHASASVKQHQLWWCWCLVGGLQICCCCCCCSNSSSSSRSWRERQISVLGGSVCKTKLQESWSKSGRKEETTRGGREGGRRRGRRQKGMMAWQPQEEGVKEICGLLHESKVPSNDQSRVWQQLQRCNRFPDFNNYLAFILCRAEVSILTHPLPLFSVSFSVCPLLLLSPQNPIPVCTFDSVTKRKKL